MPKEGLGRFDFQPSYPLRHPLKAYLDGGSPIVACKESVHMAAMNS